MIPTWNWKKGEKNSDRIWRGEKLLNIQDLHLDIGNLNDKSLAQRSKQT
jgi:hypothetical protein